jgi:hypothetical protein
MDTTAKVVAKRTEEEHHHLQTPILKKDLWSGNDVPIYAQPTNPRN